MTRSGRGSKFSFLAQPESEWTYKIGNNFRQQTVQNAASGTRLGAAFPVDGILAGGSVK